MPNSFVYLRYMINRNLFLLNIIIICEALALYFIKSYSITNSNYALMFSMILYSIIPCYLYRILRQQEDVSVINVIWNVASTFYGLLIGVLIFNEHINSYQKIGILLGTIGTCLMFMKT
jgi:multidrug transporter EmrE-like cation transporter